MLKRIYKIIDFYLRLIYWASKDYKPCLPIEDLSLNNIVEKEYRQYKINIFYSKDLEIRNERND